MQSKRKGFTLVEMIVVLVILAILTAIALPAMTKYIDKAKKQSLTVSCRACVTAAQSLVAEAYGAGGTAEIPGSAAITDLAGVKGSVSKITLDPSSHAIDTLTYTEGSQSVTYMRLLPEKYIFGEGLAYEISSVSDWAQNHTRSGAAKEYLSIDYGKKAVPPAPLSEAQTAAIFGELTPQDGDYYIYPMGIYGTDGKPLDVLYITQLNPSSTSGYGRYSAAAFIIDGKTYVSTAMRGGKVLARAEAAPGTANRFQSLMNSTEYASVQTFIDIITGSNYYK